VPLASCPTTVKLGTWISPQTLKQSIQETLRESKDRKSDLSSSSDSTFTKGGNTSKNILSRNQKRYKHSTPLSDDSEGDSDDDIDLSFRPFERNKQKQSKIRSPKICHPKKQSPVTVQNLRPPEDVQKKQQRSLVACRKINQNTNKKDNQVVLTKAGLDPIDSLIVRKASKSGLSKLKQTMESAVTDLSDEEVYNTLSEDDSHFGVSVQGHSTAQPIKIQSDDEDLGKDVGLSSDSKRRQGHHENLQEDARAFGFTKTNSKIHVSSERKSKERPPTSPDGTLPAHESSVKKRIISIFEKNSSMCDDEFSDYSARIVGLVPSEQQRRMSSISEKEGSSDWMSSTPDTSGRRNGKHVKPSEIRVFEFSNPFLASGSSKETLRCSTALNTSSLKEICPKDNGSFASIDHNVDENRSFRSASNNIVRKKNGRRPSMLSDGSSECGNVQYRSHPKSIFAGTSKEADDLEESSDNESFKDILNIKYGSKKSKGLGRSYSGLDGQLNIKFTAESRQSSRVKSVSKHW